ncbi:MAG: DUF364 domain-containing protein, partial [Syntrophales bacterium]|nr:DUF364 domain-containing protein [Syntrophales bacterium]
MEIIRDIINSITDDAPVEEVTKGIYWTAVISRFCGLSSTMIRDCASGEDGGMFPERSYTDMTALELAHYALMPDIARASVGLAAINSLIEPDYSRCVEMNASEFLIEHEKNKNVSVVGHFPFVDDLRKVSKRLWVIEKWQRPGDCPEGDAEQYLPISDIIAMSSTTLINHTLNGLLKLCPEGSIKMLLGPTTPFSEVFFQHGIDIISGSRVLDKALALKYIREGANFRELKRTGAIRLLTMMSKRSFVR